MWTRLKKPLVPKIFLTVGEFVRFVPFHELDEKFIPLVFLTELNELLSQPKQFVV